MSDAEVAGRGCCVIGFANSKEQVPWDRPNTEFLALNELHDWYENAQAARVAAGQPARPWRAWFELHQDRDIGPCGQQDRPDSDAHWRWMRALPADPERPLYMQRRREDVPASVTFPLTELYERIAARVLALQSRPMYLASSIGMMLMWAICQGRDAQLMPDGSGTHYDWIGVYGIDLASDSEYVWQRPNAEFYLGLASGLGIDVEVAQDAAILRGAGVYGYEDPPDGYPPFTRSFLAAQVAALKKQMAERQELLNKTAAEINTLHGALQVQESNLKLITDLVRRGVGAPNLANASQSIAAAVAAGS